MYWKQKTMALAGILLLAACATREGSYERQGVALEDNQGKFMQNNSPLPNGSPNTPPSEISASPSGSSLGDAPIQ